MIKNNLVKQIILPHKEIKGSCIQRYQNSCMFTAKIMKNLSGPLQGEGISLSKFSRDFHKLLPKNLSLSVKKHGFSDSYASLNRVFADNDYIVRHSFELTPNAGGKINSLHIPTIAHEVQHLADSLYQPKIMAREQLLAKSGLYIDKYLDFYEKEIYVTEGYRGKRDKRFIMRVIEHKTRKILRGLNSIDKVNFLQHMRYSLISEKNAYNAGRKFAKNLLKKNIPVYEDELIDANKDYLFDEKINLLKKMSLSIIKKEREISSKKLKKNNTNVFTKCYSST